MISLSSWLLGVIDYSVLVDGLTTAFEGGVTSALPVAAVVIAAFLVIKAIKRVVSS